jgi:hypothetical protein
MVKLVNRAKMTTSTTGSGTITLGSASDGYQSFASAGVSNSDVVRFVIEDGDAWELSSGTYTASGTTLSRTLGESSTGSLLNLTGNAVVFITAAAADIGGGGSSFTSIVENYSNGTAPSVTGNDSVGIGDNVTVSANDSYAIGHYATCAGPLSIALGLQANVLSGASQAVALGDNATVNAGTSGVALGTSYVSATDAFAAAIANNSSSYGATGANSIAMGYKAKATGSYSEAIGFQAQATNTHSVAIGRGTNSSGASGSVAIGYYADADGESSLALGHRSKSRMIGELAFASHSISGDTGASQTAIRVLVSATTDATAEAMTTNDSTASTDNQIVLPNNSAFAFHGTIVGRQQAADGTACAAWKIEGLIRREANAGTTVLVNSATTVLDNTPSWGMALSADTTNGCLKIEVTGAASTDIRWVATIHTSEVTYA